MTARRGDITDRHPLEAVEGASPSPLRAVAWAMLAGSLVALVLGAQAVLDWTNGLPVGPFSDQVQPLAQAWQDLVARTGLTGFAAGLHRLLSDWQALGG